MSTFQEIMAQKEKPAPLSSNNLDEQFWAHCAQERLCFQRCNSCDTWRHLPRHMCAACGSAQWRWEKSCGKGAIHSWTVAHLPTHPAFAGDVPYAVAIIELQEGVRMVARLSGIKPADIVLDYEVELYFEKTTGGALLPFFRPRTEAQGSAVSPQSGS
ncbi:MAG: OB-fold domain-containing protein [Proteobacteria bacterium]|nr:OB-fold domain-containing protein [Pseudomonadota bacterium]